MAETYRETWVVEAKSFLLDFDSSQVQHIRFFALALGVMHVGKIRVERSERHRLQFQPHFLTIYSIVDGSSFQATHHYRRFS